MDSNLNISRPSAHTLHFFEGDTKNYRHAPLFVLTFIKKYRTFLNELDKTEGKKKVFNEKKARLTKGKKGKKAVLPKGKKKKLDEEAKRLAKQEKAVLDVEKKLLEAVKAYVPGQRGGKAVARR